MPSREKPADLRHSLPGNPFSPVRFADEILRNTGIFAYFAAKGGAVSLRFRLAGGEGGIRTLGTGISQHNGLANLSFCAMLSHLNGLQAVWMYPNRVNEVSFGNFCSPLCSPFFLGNRDAQFSSML